MRLKRTQKSNHPWAMRERERSKEAKTRRQWCSASTRLLVATRDTTMVRKDRPWGTLISPQFLLFWASAPPAGRFPKEGRPAVRNGPRMDRTWRSGTSLRGVSSDSSLGLPGATSPFLLLYLHPTKHPSFLVSARLSRP